MVFWLAGPILFYFIIEPCAFFFPSFFFFSITFTSPSKSNLPTHLSRTRGLGWLRLWRGLLHREFVQLARNTEPALIWSRSLCSTSFCSLSFVPQDVNFISFLLLFLKSHLCPVSSSFRLTSCISRIYNTFRVSGPCVGGQRSLSQEKGDYQYYATNSLSVFAFGSSSQ